MNALELLRDWPTWSKANAATVFASSAWQMPVLFRDTDAALVHAEGPIIDALALDLMLDETRVVLSLGDSTLFPDLHRLWAKRGALPKEIVLALIERECGAVLQMLEDAVRQPIRVLGLHEDAKGAACDVASRMASLSLLVDGAPILSFSLTETPTLLVAFGRLEYLNTRAPEIRNLTRPATPVYATYALAPDEIAALKPGDFLLLPESDASQWVTELPKDGCLSLVASESREISFAEFADGTLPALPGLDSVSLALVVDGTPTFTAEPTVVGCAQAIRIKTL